MRRKQKFISVFLAILMVLSIIPVTASAAPDPYSGTCGDNLTWSFDEATGTLTISGEGAMYDYPFDDSQCYDLKSEITNVVIEDGVTSIGSSAFELFVNLKSVTIPESVTVIGDYAFDECDSLTKIVLHEGITKISEGAFSNCDYLDTVVIPGTVTEMGDLVFANCKRLANVTLCDGLTDLGLRTFSGCTSLTDIVIPESITALRGANFEGCVNLKSITFSMNIEAVGYGTFGDCVNLQDVYYTGTEEDLLTFESIPFGKNEPLFAANFHCESTIHRHSYVKTDEYVAEFCNEDSYITYTCECGHSYNGDYVKATEHSYDNGVVTTRPTCDVDGVKTFTCTACGDTYTEAVEKTGHSYDNGVITTEPNCTTEGVKTFTCYDCGHTYTEAVDSTGEHNYQLVPNTTNTGCVKTYKCSGCGDTYKEAVGTTHTQVATPEFAPTETKPGLTVGISCSSCGAVLLEQEIIPALGTTEDSSVIVSGTCGTNATWTYNTETGALVISGTGAISNYKSSQTRPWEKYEDDIKSIVINDGITKIGNYAFDNFGSLIYVSIPDSVTEIGSNVFKNCVNLKSVVMSDRLDTINYSAFEGCKNLIYVTLGKNISYIQDTTFKGCTSLTHVTVPDSVYYINAGAFAGCTNLKSVTIGKNVVAIYNNAFNECTSLTDVYYTGTEEQWKNISIGTGNDPLLKATNRYDGSGGDILSGHNNHKNTVTTIKPTCTEAGYTKFVCECGYEYTVNYDALGHNIEETPVILPSTESVGYTGGKKCTYCDMVTVEPIMVPKLNETSYTTKSGDYLISVLDRSTDTLTVYGTGTIEYGHKLHSFYYEPLNQNVHFNMDTLIITEGITGIGNEAFRGYSFKTIIIADSVKNIGTRAFCESELLESVIMGDGVQIIGAEAFKNCYRLSEMKIGKNVKSIGNHAFLYCESLEGFDVDESNLYYSADENGILYNGDKTVLILCPQGSKVANYEMPSSVKEIRAGAFYKCPYIAYVRINDGVETIPAEAFYRCENLESIVIPESVTKVGESAFDYWCTLWKVYYCGTEEQWNAITIESDNESLLTSTIYYNYNDLESASGTCGENLIWTYDASTATLTISGTGAMSEFDSIDNRPWHNYRHSVKKIVFSDGVTSISNNAFYRFSGLTTVEFADTVTTIGDYAFEDCYSLESITIPDSIISLGEGAFRECMNLSNVKLSNSLTTISPQAFAGCINLVDIVIPNSVITIDVGAFSRCKSLKNVTLSKKLTTIGISAFNECYSLKEIDIPDSVTLIEESAFELCIFMETVRIGKGITTIESKAFYNCDSLKNVYYAGSADSWDAIYIGDFNGWLTRNEIHFAIPSGTCGDNLTWEYDEKTETLTIFGTGEMEDYQIDNITGGPTHPWLDIMDKVKYLVIDDGVTSIGRCAFYDFIALESVSFANSVEIIGRSAFLDCESLKSIVIPEGVIEIQIDAFRNCTSLTNVTFPSSLLLIDAGAFDGCESLTSVIIPINVQEIGSGAFDNCPNLTDVYYEGTEEQLNEILPVISFYPTFSNATIHYNYGKSFTGIKDDYFYKDDVKQKAYQLVEFDGNFYFINDYNKIAKNKRIYLSQTFVEGFTYEDGTPLAVGYYEFDENGKMIIKNGVVGDYFYKNGIIQKAYQLVEYEGDFYFINDSHKVAKSKRIYLSQSFVEGFTYADGTPLKVGYYEFDENGKMVILNGPVGDYFYKNNVRLNAYQLVEYEGDYYFINDSHKLAKNKRIYLSQIFVEGTDLKVGYYEFDENGKLIIAQSI